MGIMHLSITLFSFEILKLVKTTRILSKYEIETTSIFNAISSGYCTGDIDLPVHLQGKHSNRYVFCQYSGVNYDFQTYCLVVDDHCCILHFLFFEDKNNKTDCVVSDNTVLSKYFLSWRLK